MRIEDNRAPEDDSSVEYKPIIDELIREIEKKETSVEEIRGIVLDCVKECFIRTSFIDWEGDDFKPVQLSENCPNEIHIGEVKHQTISTNPALVATLFPQKFGKRGNPHNGINVLICEKPVSRDALLNDYDSATDQEIMSFNVEFEYDGDGRHQPGRHSMKHRWIAPEYRGEGFGTDVLNLYEEFFQKMANEKGEKQSHIVHSSVLGILHWAEKNDYISDREEDKILWEEVKREHKTYPVDEGGRISASIVFRKDFLPE